MGAPSRRPHLSDVPLELRLTWTIPEFAAMCGIHHGKVYERLDKDDDGRTGTIRIYGITVPAHRDHVDGHWRIHRLQYEAACHRHAHQAVGG